MQLMLKLTGGRSLADSRVLPNVFFSRQSLAGWHPELLWNTKGIAEMPALHGSWLEANAA